jgi:purine-binding chemotaxis protein CheW
MTRQLINEKDRYRQLADTDNIKNGAGREAVKEEIEQFLTFYISKELFAVSILHIKELIEYDSVTDIPMMPKFIHGVINLRGNVIPVVDLSLRLDRSSAKITKRSSIVFAEVKHEDGNVIIGMLVDSVAEVEEVPKSRIEKAPDFGAKIRASFISRIAKIKDKFVIILELSSVLNISELSKIDTIRKKDLLTETGDEIQADRGAASSQPERDIEKD